VFGVVQMGLTNLPPASVTSPGATVDRRSPAHSSPLLAAERCVSCSRGDAFVCAQTNFRYGGLYAGHHSTTRQASSPTQEEPARVLASAAAKAPQ